MNQPTVTCKSCRATFIGNYCNVCGEKVYHEHHKKVGHLFEEVFHFLTHFEGSFFKTIRIIFTRPGQLSFDYCHGVRKRYFKPLSLFLLCVVIYLIFSPFEGLNMKFGTFVTAKYGFLWLAKPLVAKKMHLGPTTMVEIAKKYNEESPHISKILLPIVIPMMAGLLYLLFYKQKRYYFDHFILATEFGSLWISIKFILLPAIMLLVIQIDRSWISFFDDSNLFLELLITLILLLFLGISLHRFYRQKWLWTIPKAIVFLFIFESFIMYIYHLLQFLIIMLFI